MPEVKNTCNLSALNSFKHNQEGMISKKWPQAHQTTPLNNALRSPGLVLEACVTHAVQFRMIKVSL